MSKKQSAKQSAEDAEILYNTSAAKMIPYPVDIDLKRIDVPQDELQKANDSIMIQHLVNRGFVVQSCVPGSVEKKKVFNPKLRSAPKKVAVVIPDYLKPGDKFKIEKVGITTEVIRVQGDTAYLKHQGAFSKEIPTAITIIKEMVKREVWTRLN